VDAGFIERAFAHLATYDVVFYCPVSTFCDTGGDPARVVDPAYHQVYDALVQGLLAQWRKPASPDYVSKVVPPVSPDISQRMAIVTMNAVTFLPLPA
jgi:hypothetical protein